MKRFEKVYIEITDYCALRCAFCPNSQRIYNSNPLSTPIATSPNNMRGIMDIDLFKSLCAQLTGKTRRVCLHLLGDPLSVPNLANYITILKAYHLKVDLVTTGLFLRENDFSLLINPPFVQVSFSLSAFIANPMRLHNKHLENILSFCHYNVAHKSPIFINLRLHSNDFAANSPHLDTILHAISKHFKLSYLESTRLKSTERVKLASKVFLVPTRSFEWSRKNSSPSESLDSTQDNVGKGLRSGRFCHGTHSQIGILSNGHVVPCCIDYEGAASFGSLRTQNLHEILTSNRFIEFRHKLAMGKPASTLCAQCGYHLAR